jgi:serine/threonine protein kinase
MSSTMAVGTACYMAPEVLTSNSVNAGRELLKADVYSFGYVLWTLTTGHEPHEGESMISLMKLMQGKRKGRFQKSLPLKIAPEWPKVWKKLITACWDPNPLRRPSFEAIVPILQRLQQSSYSLPALHAAGSPSLLNSGSKIPLLHSSNIPLLSSAGNSPRSERGSELEESGFRSTSSTLRRSSRSGSVVIGGVRESGGNSSKTTKQTLVKIPEVKILPPISNPEPIFTWLTQNQLSDFIPVFTFHNIDMSELVDLEYQHLKDMGFVQIGVMLKIMRAIRSLKESQSERHL